VEILAVDDDPLLLHTISMVLEESFGEIETVEHPSLAMALLNQADIKVILLDLNFAIGDSDGAEGLAWIKKIKEALPHVAIIVLTAHGFLDVAVKSLKQGAFDFLEKPFNSDKLIILSKRATSLFMADLNFFSNSAISSLTGFLISSTVIFNWKQISKN